MKRGRLWLIGLVIACAALPGVAMAAGGPPVVTTGTASSIVDNSAVLHGSLNPNGSASTYYFQWGLTTSYGGTGAVRTSGAYSHASNVSQSASGLSPGTTYHYRLVATNQFGTTDGADQTFQTSAAPVVSTGPVSDLNTTGATLAGTVNPSGATTTYYFEWGVFGALQQSVPQTLAASTSPQSVSSSLQRLLRPGTVYHYRLIAKHQSSRAVIGSWESFMTYPSPLPQVFVSASTTPRHATLRPYILTTQGTIFRPRWMPAQYACNGVVRISFFHRHHRVRVNYAAVRPNCTYSAQTVFQHLPRGHWHRLRVAVRLLPTPYLAESQVTIQHVRLG